VRLWIDRAFTIKGSGTVATGTLGAGRLHAGDELALPDGRLVRVRGLQSLGQATPGVTAVARVALNLRTIEPDQLGRGTALLTPGEFVAVETADVRVDGDPVADLPATATLHLGSAAVTVHIRPLGKDTARLRLDRPLPLRLGDRALLRDPGLRRLAGGVTVLDVAPPSLRRRGSAAARAATLATMDGRPDAGDEVRRRLLVRRDDLRRMGVPTTVTPVAGDWLAEPGHWAALGARLTAEVDQYCRAHPLEPGIPADEVRRLLGLPDRSLVEALVRPPLVSRNGRVSAAAAGGLPGPVAQAVGQILADLAEKPFAAPEAARLIELGLGPREIAAAVRAGALLRLNDTVVLAPDAVDAAAAVLATIAQPFTLSDARQALGTTRRVAVPLLELLDRQGRTRRRPDDRRVVISFDGGD
jgi:selenocysteine-specific elongation factor